MENTVALITVLTILLIAVIGYIIHLHNRISSLDSTILDIVADHEVEKRNIQKLSKFRSSSVNWGKSIEAFVPFMTRFPIPPESVTFLGMPIDYVGFTDTDNSEKCTVHLIEVKSGKSVLSKKQWNIRKAVKEGRVEWHEISVEANEIL